MTEEKEEKDSPIYSLSPAEFKKFFEQQDINEIEYTIKCYRVTRKKGHTYKTWVKDFIDECPSEQDIAEEFGGGNFWLVSWDNEGRKVERSMWIDELWTRKLDDSKKAQGGRLLEPEARPDPLEYLSKILNDVLTPMMKVMNATNQNQGQNMGGANNPNFLEKVTESWVKSLGTIQTAVIKNHIEKIEHRPEPEKEEPEDKMSIIREVLDIAKEFGEKLLTANPVKSKIYEAAIKSDERFKELEENPDLYDALYTEAVNDPEIGKDKADRIFKKLGFDINT